MRELKFEELSTKQKLGMVNTAMIGGACTKEDLEYLLDMVRNHAIGSIWVQWDQKWDNQTAEGYIKMVREVADYPLIIMTDAESGIGEYLVGKHNAIGCTGSEKYAYAFGKVVASVARKMGYNTICNPLLDINTRGSVRMYGSDKYQIAKMAAAEARGMHDGGVLTIAKHYPGGENPKGIDSHMTEGYSEQTAEELIERDLYPYRELMKEDLIDGIMTGHTRFVNIDPTAPATLSKPVIDIIRNLGFEGFAITDALKMMGIRAKYGEVECMGLSVAAGNEFAFRCDSKTRFNQEALNECYEKGIITDERLDEAVKRILAAQHKVMLMETREYDELDEDVLDTVRRINKDSVYAKFDEGLTASISRDGRHYFAIMVKNGKTVDASDIDEDTFNAGWFHTGKVLEQIQRLFPNSVTQLIYQFPDRNQCQTLLSKSVDYDDVIYLTFTEPIPYVGREHLTRRIEMQIEALQYTNRVSTVVHFGNPCVLGNLPHIPRYILGGLSEASVETCLEVLAGEYEPHGILTYDAKLN